MKTILHVLAMLGASFVLAAPAGALTCVAEERMNWSEEFPRIDAAFVGLVESTEVVPATSTGSGYGRLPASMAMSQRLAVCGAGGPGRGHRRCSANRIPPWTLRSDGTDKAELDDVPPAQQWKAGSTGE